METSHERYITLSSTNKKAWPGMCSMVDKMGETGLAHVSLFISKKGRK